MPIGQDLFLTKDPLVYYTFTGCNLVAWRNKKQSVVARFSVEVEYQSMAHGIRELLWLNLFLSELQFPVKGPMSLYCNNKAVINIAHNLVQRDCIKYIEVDHHFLKEKIMSC